MGCLGGLGPLLPFVVGFIEMIENNDPFDISFEEYED